MGQRKFEPNNVAWVVRRRLRDSVIVPLRHCFQYARSNRFSALRKLRGSARSSPVLLLGNGPSRDQLPNEIINSFQRCGGTVICVNWWWSQNTEWSPDIVVFSDPNAHTSPQFTELLQRTTLGTQIALPADRQFTAIMKNQMLQQFRVVPFCGVTRRYRWTSKKLIRPDKPQDFSAMTLFRALAIAAWLEPKIIYVLGMDNTLVQNFSVDALNSLWLSMPHHGCSDHNDAPKKSKLYYSVADFLHDQQNAFRSTQAFKNISIINLDPNSLTDGFPKMRSMAESINLIRGASIFEGSR